MDELEVADLLDDGYADIVFDEVDGDIELLEPEADDMTSERDEAVREEHGRKRIWHLAGHYVDDLSVAKYTLPEIEGWLSWDAHNLRHPHAFVHIFGKPDGREYYFDVSDRFADPCNDSPGDPGFETLCERLAEYVQERRENAARHN